MSENKLNAFNWVVVMVSIFLASVELFSEAEKAKALDIVVTLRILTFTGALAAIILNIRNLFSK